MWKQCNLHNAYQSIIMWRIVRQIGLFTHDDNDDINDNTLIIFLCGNV